jgi:hypothetical protein
MHVVSLAADKRFVNLDLATEFSENRSSHRQSDPLQHEPRGLLCHSKSAGQVVRTDATLTIRQQPQGRKPLLKRNGGVLEDRSRFQRELGAFMPAVTLPNPCLVQIGQVVGIAFRPSGEAIGPPRNYHKLAVVLVIAEKLHGFQDPFWEYDWCSSWSVQYLKKPGLWGTLFSMFSVGYRLPKNRSDIRFRLTVYRSSEFR